MSTMSSSLLELILDLLSDDEALQKYEANKEQYLADAGLSGCAAEVDDAVSMSTDLAPSSHKAAFSLASNEDEGEEDTGGNSDSGGDENNGGDGNNNGDGDGDGNGHGHAYSVTNHYTTNNENHSTTTTHNGDKYDISAEGDVALPGGINFGRNNEIEDFDYSPEDSFNDATVGGDGVAATGNADVDIDGGVGNTNGSGVMNADVDGDLNNAGGSGSEVYTGDIDNSVDVEKETDIDVDVEHDTDIDTDIDVDADLTGNNIGSEDSTTDVD
jgi:hypothetical protein